MNGELEESATEGLVALACELDNFGILSLAMERNEQRIANQARIAIEVVLDGLAQVAVCR